MEKDTKNNAIQSIKSDIDRGLGFHERSFEELEKKAKYWLTFCLPSIGLITSYLFANYPTLSPSVLASLSAVVACLLFAVFRMANSIRLQTVSSGSVMPESEEFDELLYYADGTWKKFEKFSLRQCQQRFDALKKYRAANKKKSKAVSEGESLLFFALPVAPIVAGIIAIFLQIVVSKLWFVVGGFFVSIFIGIFVVSRFSGHND